jgi:hypothetical protein
LYATDFIYDGRNLSDFGWVICNMTTDSSGFTLVDYGSQLQFNMVKPVGSDKWRMYSSSYNEYLTVTFQIGKISCDAGPEEVTTEEYREMMRWLNRKGFHDFSIVQTGYEFIHYEGSFNIQPIQYGGRVYGAELTFTSNRPYGLGTAQRLSYEITEEMGKFDIFDISDEIGHIYPDMIIQCRQDGDLSLYNDIEDRTMLIKNCKDGEILNVFGESKIITSTISTHAVYNDFNYRFFRLANTETECQNIITVSIPCQIDIIYIPIRKIGIN